LSKFYSVNLPISSFVYINWITSDNATNSYLKTNVDLLTS